MNNSSSRSMDGVRAVKRMPPQTRPVSSTTTATVAYPDLDELLAPVSIEPEPRPRYQQELPAQREASVVAVPSQVVAQPAPALSTHAKPRVRSLRVVRKGLARSGFSWFFVVAVVSSGFIGVFSLLEGGRAAQQELNGHATQAQQAFASAASALTSQEPEFALTAFDEASGSLLEIQRSLDNLSGSVRAVVALLPGDPLASADQIAQAGIHVATAGKALTHAIQVLGGVQLAESIEAETLGGQVQPSQPVDTSLTDALLAIQPDVQALTAELTEAGRLIVAADTRGLPGSIAEPLREAQQAMPGLLQGLHKVSGLVSVLAELGGASRARTYAVVFQNPNELRPTGGFWGQIAFVKMQNGRVEKLDIKSIYDPAGQVISLQHAPEGLDVISPSFALQDANWFADFPTSARVLMGFLSETGDPRLDGVIALNPKVVTDLLALTGPVLVDDLGVRVSEDTFVAEAQYEVADKDPDHDQAFFPGFAENFLEQLFSLDQSKGTTVVQTFLDAVARKDIQFFFGEEELRTLPETIGADGVLVRDADLVAPVFANIGGGKTDQYIDESRSLDMQIQGDVVRHELTITRRDTRTDQFKDRDNRSYFRLYVPEGAQLVSISGLDTDLKALSAHVCDECEPAYGTPLEERVDWEPATNTKIYREAGHTVFANWVTLQPGDERTIRVLYDLPRADAVSDGVLKLHLWRQPGSSDIPLDLVVHESGGVSHVTGAQKQDGLYLQRLVLDRDRVVGILLE